MEHKENPELDAYRKRADHEDNLHNSRAGLFLTFNSLMAVAVGLTGDVRIRIGFAIIVLIINFLWLTWAWNGRRFIQALRKAHSNTPDQELHIKMFGEGGKKGILGPINIIGRWIPLVLLFAWLLLLAFFLLQIHSIIPTIAN